jgi:hypothetical protein
VSLRGGAFIARAPWEEDNLLSNTQNKFETYKKSINIASSNIFS